MQASTLVEDKKAGANKKLGGRRRDREAEVQVAGQERSLKRRRNRRDDNVLSAGFNSKDCLDEALSAVLFKLMQVARTSHNLSL